MMSASARPSWCRWSASPFHSSGTVFQVGDERPVVLPDLVHHLLALLCVVHVACAYFFAVPTISQAT